MLPGVEHCFILVSAVSGRVVMTCFAFVVGIPIGITSAALGVKICAITAAIKKYKSIVKKERKKDERNYC